jgi:hypothetical protein
MEAKNKDLVGLDDPTVVKDKAPIFKAQQDKYYRIHIPDVSKIFKYSQHYHEEAKFARCFLDKEASCPICDLGLTPTLKFKVNMLLYNTTTEDGTLPEDLNYVSLTNQVFRFGSKVWTSLRAKHKKNAKLGGLTKIDLILKCTNGQYQHFDIEDYPECAIAESERLQKMAKMAISKFEDFLSPDNLDARYLSDSQLKIYLARVKNIPPNMTAKEELDSIEQELKIVQEVEDLETPDQNLEDLI